MSARNGFTWATARAHGLNPSTLATRLHRGWPLERALAAPVRTPQVTKERKQLDAEMRKRLRRRVRNGMPVTTAARVFGVSRRTAHRVLKEDEQC